MENNKKISVIYIEDNPGHARLLMKRLEKEGGFQVEWANNPDEAIKKVEKYPLRYDVILSDFNMPGKSGLEIVVDVRSWQNPPPIIMVTASGCEEVAVEAMQAGASDYLVKDVDSHYLTLLPTVIHNAINKHKIENEKRIAEEKLSRLNALLKAEQEAVCCGVLVVGVDGELIRYNKRFLEIWNIPESLAKEGDEKKLLHHVEHSLKDWKEFIALIKDLYQHPKEERIGDIIELKSGKILSRNTRPVLLENGEIIGRLWDFEDITKLKKGEEALRHAKEKAEEATKLKDKFLSIVAHDLRAPFTAIIGNLEMLLKDADHPLNAGQKEILERGMKSAKALVKMTDELLEVSLLQTRNMTPKARFIDGYIATGFVIQSLAPLAAEKGVELVNDVPPGTRLYADDDLFSRVIQNLVSNAIKFCNKGDSIRAFGLKDRASTIAVQDTGVGIEEEYISDIFKYDVKTSTLGTAKEKGTGLGLPLSCEIMQAHSGTLKVDSQKGSGSIFFAELPYIKPRILLVDDESTARFFFKKTLEKIDVEVVEAKNGEEALAVLEKSLIHLIVSDVNMPILNGFQLLDRVKKNARTKSIPVIMVTSDIDMETNEKAIRLGADDFVTKPLKHDDFLPRVRRFVK